MQKPPRQARMALHQAPGLLVFSERRNNKRWMFPPPLQEFYLGVPNGLSVGTLPSPAKSMPLAPPPPPALPPRAQPPVAPPQSAAPQAPSSPLGGGLCEPPQKKAKIGLADAAEAAKSGQAACQDVSMSATDVDPALPRPGLLEGATPKSQARVGLTACLPVFDCLPACVCMPVCLSLPSKPPPACQYVCLLV